LGFDKDFEPKVELANPKPVKAGILGLAFRLWRGFDKDFWQIGQVRPIW